MGNYAMKILFASLVALSALAAQNVTNGAPGTVEETTLRFEQQCAALPQPLAKQFRALGAKALAARHPSLAKRLTDPVDKPGTGGSPIDPASSEAGAAIV